MDKAKKPNKKLQHERNLHGWSQARVAEMLGTTVKRVSMWECGDAAPDRYYQEKLCEVFHKNTEELGLVEAQDDQNLSSLSATSHPKETPSETANISPDSTHLNAPLSTSSAQPVQLLIPGSAPVYVTIQVREQAFAQLPDGSGIFVPVDGQPHAAAYSSYESTTMPTEESEGDTVKRREFFRETGRVVVGGAALLASRDMLSAELLDRFQRALEKPSTVDTRMLAYLERRVGEYWQDRHSAVLASSDLLGYVLDHLQKVTQLLEEPLLPAQRIQLYAIASKTALLVGELFIDMSYYSRARQYDEIAIKAAQQSNDQSLEAVTRGRMSLAWTYSENIPQALTNVQHARYLADGHSAKTVCSWLAAIEAEAHANLHNRESCLKALDDAELIEDQPDTSKDNYLIHFDRALLRGYQGVCFRRLYDPDNKQSTLFLTKAQTVLLDSLNLLNPTLVQRQPTFLADLAETYLRQGEIEEACQRAVQATTGAAQIKLQKVVLRIQKLQRELEPWRDTPHVKKLDSHLAALHS